LTPSDAVSVAATLPPDEHVMKVSTANGSKNEQSGSPVVHTVVSALSGSLTVPSRKIASPTLPDTSGPAFTVGGKFPTTVMSATSLTGGFTPSSAVRVAATTPVVVHEMVVSTRFALPNEHVGESLDQCVVGDGVSGSVTVPSSEIGVFTSPVLSGPALTDGALLGWMTCTSAVSKSVGLTPSCAVRVAAKMPAAVHVTSVSAAFGALNEQFGLSIVHCIVGV
jgi:hypothetical protein